jgi:hypothetical protein
MEAVERESTQDTTYTKELDNRPDNHNTGEATGDHTIGINGHRTGHETDVIAGTGTDFYSGSLWMCPYVLTYCILLC